MQHYGNRPDVIDFNKKYDLNFNLGSAVKYLARAGKKQNETKQSDLKKAIDFITRELEVIEPETVNAKAGLEVGRWYTGGIILLGCYTGNDKCYGFFDGEYSHKWRMSYPNYHPATEEEVKAALIKEAQRRYKVGDRLIDVLNGRKGDLEFIDEKRVFCFYNDEKGPRLLNSGVYIFNNGKWASHA